MRTRALLVAAIVGLLVLAACGNDDNDKNNNASKTVQTTTAASSDAMTVTFKADLTGGTTEVPQPGDPDGKGNATVKIDADAGKVCYTIAVENIATPVASHIHEGAAGGSGGILITFNPEKIGKGEDCLSGQPTDVLKKIVANPSGFYVNVHTGDFPGGAVRGQLAAS